MSSTTTVTKDQTMTNQQNTMSIEAFYEALERHDWFFGWSDDPRAYRDGTASYAALEVEARAGGESFQLLMAEYSKYCFSGEPWNTPKHPKPPAPGKTKKVAVVSLKEADERDSRLSSSGYYVPNVGTYTGQSRLSRLITSAWFYAKHLVVALAASVR